MTLQRTFATVADQLERSVESAFDGLADATPAPARTALDRSKDLSLTAIRQWRGVNEQALEMLDELAERIREVAEKLLEQGEALVGEAGTLGRNVASTAGRVGREVAAEVDEAADEIADAVEDAVESVVAEAKEEAADVERAVQRGVGELKASALRSRTKAELYELAQERDIEGRASMTKAQLVSALTA